MPTYYGDSYGQIAALEQADQRAADARSQDALRLIMGLRQQKLLNERAERDFQVNQQKLITDLAHRQEAFDTQKALAFKGIEADAAKLEFEKIKQQAVEKEAANTLAFKKDNLAANLKFGTEQRQLDLEDDAFAQAMEESKRVQFDPFDVEQTFPEIKDPKKRDTIVRQSKQVFDEQNQTYERASKIAELLNTLSGLEKESKKFKEDDRFYKIMPSAEKKAEEIRQKRIQELKSRSAKFTLPSGELSKAASPLITVDENGDYVPLVRKPKTFRDMYPDRVRAREEAVNTDPQSYDEAIGAVGLPFSPPLNSRPMADTSSGNFMMDAGLAAGPVAQAVSSQVDPRTAMVIKLMDNGMTIEEARKAANRYLQAQEQSTWFGTP